MVLLKALLVENLTKIYGGGNVGVENLSFQVDEGEIYGLIGPNGSGKTTTLRIISTLLKPTRGDVKVYGVSVRENPLKVRSFINYLPEEAGAYRDLTGLDFIKLMLSMRLKGDELRKAVEEAVEISGLGEALRRPIRTYSKGMKRLVAVSTVLASKPRLLLLDEPTSGMDVENSLRIRQLIKQYNREKSVTVVLSSHNMLEVETLCDRVGILYKGKLVAEGRVQELKSAYGGANLEEVFLKARGV